MEHSKDFLEQDPKEASSVIKDGVEFPHPEPSFEIVGQNLGDTELDRIRAMIRNEVSQVAAAHEFETFEEANDFDVDDGWDEDVPETKYMKEEIINFPSTGNKGGTFEPARDNSEVPPDPKTHEPENDDKATGKAS